MLEIIVGFSFKSFGNIIHNRHKCTLDLIPETKIKGEKLLAEKLGEMEEDGFKEKLKEKLKLVKEGKRDLYF